MATCYNKRPDDARCSDSLCCANLSIDKLISPRISPGSNFFDPLTRNVMVVAGLASLKIPPCYIPISSQSESRLTMGSVGPRLGL